MITPACDGLTSVPNLEVQPASGRVSQTGVSTRSVPCWYAVRCAYGTERKADEFLQRHGIRTFCPTIMTKKEVDGKARTVRESCLPNILFAYGTFDDLKMFVYDNVHDETRNLRFYYNRHHDGTKEPLIVPDSQIESLRLICESGDENVICRQGVVRQFRRGQDVVVTGGAFKGVRGKVARYAGQQRVAVIVDELVTVTTAYVPKGLLGKEPTDSK